MTETDAALLAVAMRRLRGAEDTHDPSLDHSEAGLIVCDGIESQRQLVAQLETALRDTRAALQRVTALCEQVAWTNRGMADVSHDGYWSFVPTDEVKRAAAVLAGVLPTSTNPWPGRPRRRSPTRRSDE